MIIQSSNGISFGSKSSALFVSPATYAKPLGNKDDAMEDVAMWGTNNDLPELMRKDIEATGVLSAAMQHKARIAVGKGPMPARIVGYTEDGYEQLEFIADPEIHDWLEMNNSFETSYASVLDMFQCGNNFRQILLSGDRKIIGYKRHDPWRCRFSVVDENTRKSEKVYISGDWAQYTQKTDKKHLETVSLLDRDYPLLDLQSRTDGYSYMLSCSYPLFGRQYYAPAPWYVALKWVKIAQAIPEMKTKMFENQMTIKYVVEIHPDFWPELDPTYPRMTPEAKLAFQNKWYDNLDLYLTGNDNAYKSLFTRLVLDKKNGEYVPGVKITTLDDKIKDGKLIPDAGAANSEILFALAMNPALMGVDIPGGGSVTSAGSGSNIREAFLVQVMMLELERRQDSQIFNMAKITNGWQKRLGKGNPLVLRFPNQILTTLNTGKNTQPTA